MAEPSPIEVHKALADDTRYRLYRYLRLSGRAVTVRELSTRLGLHVDTLRPHLRRLEEAGLVRSEALRGASVGRPQTVYAAIDREAREGRDYRLFADIVAGQVRGARQRDRALAQIGEHEKTIRRERVTHSEMAAAFADKARHVETLGAEVLRVKTVPYADPNH